MNLSGVVHLNKKGACILCGIVIFSIYMFTNVNHHQTNQIHLDVEINLKQLLKASLNAAINGGHQVVAVKDNLNIKSKGLTKEGMNDSVTTADFLSHCTMMATLKLQFPELAVISEEAKTECNQKQQDNLGEQINYDGIIENLPEIIENQQDITVWIDPLDATHEYTEKLYQYVTTMVCVSVRGEPVIGVIHKPFEKKTSWAWVGKGQSTDLKPTAPKSDSDKVKIIISRSHSGDIRDLLKKQFDNYEIIEAAGAGYKSLEVVNGTVDAYIHVTAIKKWDICAGNAIINAVGGRMTTKHGDLIDYSDTVHSINEDGLIATVHNHKKFIEKSYNITFKNQKFFGSLAMFGVVNCVRILKTKFNNFVQISFTRKYLFYTNVAISTTLSGVGDIIEQHYEILKGDLNEWNRIRTRNMSISGMTIGVFCHYWYNFLDKRLPGYNIRIVMKKVIIDQFVCSPMTITTLFLTVGVLENKNKSEIWDEMKEKALTLYTAEWVVWPPAQFINFYFLPTKYRVLYDNTISLGYDIYTSYVKNSKVAENI